MARLPRRFYRRPAPVVARELIGHVVVRRDEMGILRRARIVETEAYGPDDPASHAFGGETRRNRVMFGPSGHLYVYFTYGMHWCMNVVTGEAREGSAVLLRAAEPLAGLDAMRRARRTTRDRDLCRGPARLAQAFGVDGSFDGADLCRGTLLWVSARTPPPRRSIVSGPRIGVTRGVDLPWRFSERDSVWVSRRPGLRDLAAGRP